MGAQGTATLDFGLAPGSSSATITVTGQTGIDSATSSAEAWLMADTTASHNATEHAFVPMTVRCGSIVNNTGFTIYAFTDLRLTGTFKVRWVWA